MTVKNILVAFNGTETAEGALGMALALGRRHDAHVTGLFAHAVPAHYGQLGNYMTADMANMLARQEEEIEAKVRGAWEAALKAEDSNDRVSFFVERRYPNDVLAEFARTYDLVVVGQPEGDSFDAYQEPHPDSIALYSGRPVLMVPKGYRAVGDPKDVVVAWDGKRAAARALAEAMAMVEKDGKVTVLSVGDRVEDLRRPGRDIMEHLSRHDVEAELLTLPTAGRSIGEVILEACSIGGTGLLVMGAYEHSRFAETFLGGVTKNVLRSATVPVLMAH